MASLKNLVVWILFYLMNQLFYCEGQEHYPHVSFNGMVMANHSYVNLLLVNNTESGSVQCHTDLSTCCRMEQGPHRGDWFFPNGSVLGFRSSSDNIVENRGPERVDLQHRNNGSASGIYHCSIATTDNHNNDDTDRGHVYVGLYDSGGQYTPKISACGILYTTSHIFVGDITLSDTIEFTSSAGDQFILTCISTGGPATTVTWTRDSATLTEGTETVLNNPVTAQYTHTLTMTGRLGGLYTCTVSNNKPSSDSSSLRVKGIRTT